MTKQIKRRHVREQSGFSIVEVLVSLYVIVILIGVASNVIVSSGSVNKRTSLSTDAAELVFDKIQNYINQDFNSIPVGALGANFEVEDFSSEAVDRKLTNASAKVYIQPKSVIPSGSSTTTTVFTERFNADSTYSGGGEIAATNDIDPGNENQFDDNIRNNSRGSDYTYNRSYGSANHPMVAIDLGSVQSVDTIRIDWYHNTYASTNFRIEGNNSNSSSGWSTVVSGLSRTVNAGSVGSNPQDIPVGGASFRYWRMFNVTGSHPGYIAISEMEAFRNGSGDVAEESSSGVMNFSDTSLELTQVGGAQQSVGTIFNAIDLAKDATIDSAYIQFTAGASDSSSVSLRARGIAVDSALRWSSANRISTALSATPTTASSTWNLNAASAWTTGQTLENQRLDVTTIVQELVNRTGWVTGNNMAFGITHTSGGGRRVATKSTPPQLVVNWSSTAPSDNTIYIDADSDGYVDNPTLLEIRAVVDYDTFGTRRSQEYTTLIRKNGLGGL